MSLTRRNGECVPKQYCALRGTATMLDWALARARGLASSERVTTIVAAEHRRWWHDRLAPGSFIVQPSDRGTAAGILLPLLWIRRRDPAATLLVLPADHYVRDESAFRVATRRVLARAEAEKERVILLGVAPEGVEPGLGWLVPVRARQEAGVFPVECFREKPPAEEAERLAASGALVNTFVFAASVKALLRLYRRYLPEILGAFEQADWENVEGLEACYATLPSRDFSRDLLEPASSWLDVVEAPSCGWSDLGTPERVGKCLAETRSAPTRWPRTGWHVGSPPLELAAVLQGGAP